jgi:hypothetical protein
MRTFMFLSRSILVMSIGLVVSPSASHAEEGLWTLAQAARPDVGSRLGLPGDENVAERLRADILRFSSGESGTLVSSRGLVVTVRSAAAACLQVASRDGADLVQAGFWSGNGEDLRCPYLSVEQLVEGKDVTAQLRRGIEPQQPIPPERIALLEEQCRAESGLECRVTSLFSGGVMRLSRYRRYDDVRLVFAPEYRVAAFGPPSMRMHFPRYALDVAFFRIYERDKPLPSGAPISWHASGPAGNDRIIVASYPGVTERRLPWLFLEGLAATGYRLQAKMARGQALALFARSRKQRESAVEEETRARIQRLAAEIRNTLAQLQNQPIKRKQRLAAGERRKTLADLDAKLAETVGAAVVAADKGYARLYRRYLVVEGDRVLPFGRLFDLGRKLVRWTEQRQKPQGERLPEFQGGNLADIERQLAAPVPLSAATEEVLLAGGLKRLGDELGPKDPLVQTLGSEAPAERAASIVAGTKLMDAAIRRRVLASGELGEAADDPLVVLVRTIEGEGGPLRLAFERDVRRELAAYARAVGEQMAAAKEAHYADASGDLRLSSGRVRGFLDSGRVVPAQALTGGMIVRAGRAQPGSPWELPARWREKRPQIDLGQPLNFVVDADVGSGAPGGAVLDRNGELLGIVIDTTAKSAVNRFQYRGADDRAVAVHAAGIVEALRHVYDAGKLVDEVTGGKR